VRVARLASRSLCALALRALCGATAAIPRQLHRRREVSHAPAAPRRCGLAGGRSSLRRSSWCARARAHARLRGGSRGSSYAVGAVTEQVGRRLANLTWTTSTTFVAVPALRVLGARPRRGERRSPRATGAGEGVGGPRRSRWGTPAARSSRRRRPAGPRALRAAGLRPALTCVSHQPGQRRSVCSVAHVRPGTSRGWGGCSCRRWPRIVGPAFKASEACVTPAAAAMAMPAPWRPGPRQPAGSGCPAARRPARGASRPCAAPPVPRLRWTWQRAELARGRRGGAGATARLDGPRAGPTRIGHAGPHTPRAAYPALIMRKPSR